jgi:hypothetical protein
VFSRYQHTNAESLLSLFSGLPYQTLYPAYFNA